VHCALQKAGLCTSRMQLTLELKSAPGLNP
jgi:hypothetical protein